MRTRSSTKAAPTPMPTSTHKRSPNTTVLRDSSESDMGAAGAGVGPLDQNKTAKIGFHGTKNIKLAFSGQKRRRAQRILSRIGR
jgi:hypothetical protein